MNKAIASGYAMAAWTAVATLMWLFASFLIWFATDLSYKAALTCEAQAFLLIFVYWWMPALPIACGVYDKLSDE